MSRLALLSLLCALSLCCATARPVEFVDAALTDSLSSELYGNDSPRDLLAQAQDDALIQAAQHALTEFDPSTQPAITAPRPPRRGENDPKPLTPSPAPPAGTRLVKPSIVEGIVGVPEPVVGAKAESMLPSCPQDVPLPPAEALVETAAEVEAEVDAEARVDAELEAEVDVEAESEDAVPTNSLQPAPSSSSVPLPSLDAARKIHVHVTAKSNGGPNNDNMQRIEQRFDSLHDRVMGRLSKLMGRIERHPESIEDKEASFEFKA